jgi:hypothetical protein
LQGHWKLNLSPFHINREPSHQGIKSFHLLP